MNLKIILLPLNFKKMTRSNFFFSLIALGATSLFGACSSTTNITDGRHQMTGKENIRTPEMMTQSFKVAGNCVQCQKRIETATKNVKGVTQANWNADKQILVVMFFPQQADATKIMKAVADAGHDNEKFKADDTTFKKLPECCQYDRSRIITAEINKY